MADTENGQENPPPRARSRSRERSRERDRERDKPAKRGRDEDDRDGPVNLHYRLLVHMKKAGSVIGKGGDFIALVRSETRAKLAVDKAVPGFDERLVHVQALDDPHAAAGASPAQQGLVLTAQRILGTEVAGGGHKMPDYCELRLLVFKWQVGAVMGKRGATINRIRSNSAATIKVIQPERGMPVVPCAVDDDELILLSGTWEQVQKALVEVSEEIRRLPPEQAAAHMLKRSRAAHADMMGPPPPMQGPVGIPCLLPPDLEVEFEANDAMHLEGLEGLVTVEYRLLIPDRKVGAILGSGGNVINHIRAYSGARIILEEGPRRSPHRMLVLTSTEPCHARRCAAFEATIYAVQHLLHDDAPNAPSHVRMVVGREQIGSIMGKAGSTIKTLRNVVNLQVNLQTQPDDLKDLGRRGDEVLDLEGPISNVNRALLVALLLQRGNFARGQLLYKHPPPPNSPPPTNFHALPGGPPPLPGPMVRGPPGLHGPPPPWDRPGPGPERGPPPDRRPGWDQPMPRDGPPGPAPGPGPYGPPPGYNNPPPLSYASSQPPPQQQQPPPQYGGPPPQGSAGGSYYGVGQSLPGPPGASGQDPGYGYAAPAAAAPSQPAYASSAYAPAPAAAAVAAAPAAAAPPAGAVPLPQQYAMALLLTQEQVVALRLTDPVQLAQITLLSGAQVRLADGVTDTGARTLEVVGDTTQCTKAKNIIEALMKSV